MPTYEYRCERGHAFERFQKMSDEPVSTCPDCGGDAERVLSGGAGFVFKGEGFYATDYRSEEYRKKSKKEKEPESSGGGDASAPGAGDDGGGSTGEATGEASSSASGGGAGE